MIANINNRASVLIQRAAALSLILTVVACAAPRTRYGNQKDPFADPSRFESLASRVPPAEPAKDFSSHSLVSTALPNPVPDAFLHSVTESLTSHPMETPTGHATEAAMTPVSALSNLTRGNERFVSGVTNGEHRDGARRRALASGQNPSTIILSCSDSRVPPELIFDQGLGDLFTIRVAGNVLGSAQVASIEYAIEHLGAKLVVVLGHESCGAVKAALASKPKVSSGSTDLDWLVGEIKPNLRGRAVASIGDNDLNIRQPVMANVDAVTEQLTVRSHIISHAMGEGKLKVVRGIYSLESGKVDFWGVK